MKETTFDPSVFDVVVTYMIPFRDEILLVLVDTWRAPQCLHVPYIFVRTTDATALPHHLQGYWVSVKVANGVSIHDLQSFQHRKIAPLLHEVIQSATAHKFKYLMASGYYEHR